MTLWATRVSAENATKTPTAPPAGDDAPAGGDTVYLVANAGTSQWGSHQIRSLLSLRGNQAPEFFAPRHLANGAISRGAGATRIPAFCRSPPWPPAPPST